MLGEDRLCEGDKGKALAAHATLNRLELGALGEDTRYRSGSLRPVNRAEGAPFQNFSKPLQGHL